MRVVQLNPVYDARLGTPGDLLDRYTTLTGWSEALVSGGADVLTVQRFHADAAVTRRDCRYVFGSVRTILRATAEFGPEIVHINGLTAHVTAWRVRRYLPRNAAVVVQDHASGPPPDRGWVSNRLRRWLMRAPDAFLFTAAEQARPWREHGYIRETQRTYEVAEASTDIRPVPREAARAESHVGGAPAIVWVGRLNGNKDPLTVLAAFERLAVAAPEACLTMVYQAEDLIDAVRAYINERMALRGRVRLVGRVPHERLAAFYSAADLFVLGSHHEGSGYALVEALACGAVPVVTDIASFRVLTNNGSIGRLWPPGDVDGCASALLDLSADDLAAARERTRLYFERELTWAAIGQRALRVYEAIVASRR